MWEVRRNSVSLRCARRIYVLHSVRPFCKANQSFSIDPYAAATRRRYQHRHRRHCRQNTVPGAGGGGAILWHRWDRTVDKAMLTTLIFSHRLFILKEISNDFLPIRSRPPSPGRGPAACRRLAGRTPLKTAGERRVVSERPTTRTYHD